ncbi:hypothetical protein [Metamycoplasma gateae]|uniref:Uncharacterized protein n=1 Tax=Metamycoplasma gateae TaxID=35769 RepID=A0ABZ2ALM7_9BACT|nr:hypothetical protein V2E26_01450 [Metamycoplasma gateae]
MKKTKLKILLGFLSVGAATALGFSIAPLIKGCVNKNEPKAQKNEFEEELKELNIEADVILDKSLNLEREVELLELLEEQKLISELKSKLDILNSKIQEKNYTEDDFSDIYYQEGKKVLLPETLNNEKLVLATQKNLEKAKLVGSNYVNNLDSWYTEEEKNKLKEAIESSTTIEEVIEALKSTKEIAKERETFLNNVEASNYFSQDAKEFIKEEFNKHKDQEKIENFIDSYTYVESIKKHFFDAHLTDEADFDEAIKYQFRNEYLGAVNVEKIKELEDNFNESVELKNQLLNVTLKEYKDIIEADKNNIHKTEDSSVARLVMQTQALRLLFVSTKEQIQKASEDIKYLISIADDQEELEKVYFKNRFEKNDELDSSEEHKFGPHFALSFIYSDENYRPFEQIFEYEFKEEDFTTENNAHLNPILIDRHNDKNIFILNWFDDKQNDVAVHPHFVNVFNFTSPLFNFSEGIKNLEGANGFSFYHLFSGFFAEKDVEKFNKQYLIKSPLIKKLFQHINDQRVIEKYNEYFEANNVDVEKAVKRNQYLLKLIGEIYSNKLSLKEILRNEVIIEYFNYGQTEEEDKIEENLKKFLEVLDRNIE